MAGNVEIERLVAEMEILPAYRGWSFTYEYPGLFCYSHADRAHLVFFTPDYHGDDQLPIEVQDAAGHLYEQHSSVLPMPHRAEDLRVGASHPRRAPDPAARSAAPRPARRPDDLRDRGPPEGE
jgi:hypothetical protein